MIPSKVALTIFALQGLSSGVIDKHCSAAENLSMSQPAIGADSDDEQPSLEKQRVSTNSTGWFMQGATGIDKGYLTILKEAEEKGKFWSEASISVSSDSVLVTTTTTETRITLARDVKAGDLFDDSDFRGHWIPIGVDSPVEGKIESWPATP